MMWKDKTTALSCQMELLSLGIWMQCSHIWSAQCAMNCRSFTRERVCVTMCVYAKCIHPYRSCTKYIYWWCNVHIYTFLYLIHIHSSSSLIVVHMHCAYFHYHRHIQCQRIFRQYKFCTSTDAARSLAINVVMYIWWYEKRSLL